MCDKQILKNHPKRKLYNNIASKYTTILIQNFRKECVLHMQQNLGQAQTKTEQKIVSIYFVKKNRSRWIFGWNYKKVSLSFCSTPTHNCNFLSEEKDNLQKKRKKSCFCRFFACFYFNHTFSASYLQLEQKGGKKNFDNQAYFPKEKSTESNDKTKLIEQILYFFNLLIVMKPIASWYLYVETYFDL